MYNGWTNYETWVVKLWIDNEEGSQSFWNKQADFLLSEAGQQVYSTRYEFSTPENGRIAALAELLKEEHEDRLPKLEGFAADLLGAAMSEVNWREIAESLLEDTKERLAE